MSASELDHFSAAEKVFEKGQIHKLKSIGEALAFNQHVRLQVADEKKVSLAVEFVIQWWCKKNTQGKSSEVVKIYDFRHTTLKAAADELFAKERQDELPGLLVLLFPSDLKLKFLLETTYLTKLMARLHTLVVTNNDHYPDYGLDVDNLIEKAGGKTFSI